MKISVSILCYNYGRYLTRAIESVLSQDLPPGVSLEVLVLDDGSTDCTPEVCARYSAKIRSIRSENLGFPATLTRAVMLATGQYICLLDADDFFAEGKIANIVSYLSFTTLFLEHRQIAVDHSGNVIASNSQGGNTSTLCIERAAALTLLPVENEVAFHALKLAGHGVSCPLVLGMYTVHDLSMTNRDVPGLQNSYLSGVHRRLGDRIRQRNFQPFWLSRRQKRSISGYFIALGCYNAIEASLERGRRWTAASNLLRLYLQIVLHPENFSLLYFKMIFKVILGRPSFPKEK